MVDLTVTINFVNELHVKNFVIDLLLTMDLVSLLKINKDFVDRLLLVFSESSVSAYRFAC